VRLSGSVGFAYYFVDIVVDISDHKVKYIRLSESGIACLECAI